MNTNTRQLKDHLAELSYEGLFLYLDDTALTQIWNVADGEAQLGSLVLDETLVPTTRFLAAEILFAKVPHYPPETHHAALASIYAQVLAAGGGVNANIWGMPGELDGVVGQHLMCIGQKMVAQLVPLLADNTQMFYEGSEEATIGNMYQYRVKDFAAFFISRLTNMPYALHTNPEARDVEIEQLKQHLKS